MNVLKRYTGGDQVPGVEGFTFHCPGCNQAHSIRTKRTDEGPTWGFNGDLVKPTFTPSILTWWDEWIGDGVPGKPHRCHSYVTDGNIQFLGDCLHDKAGQTVPLPPHPDEGDE